MAHCQVWIDALFPGEQRLLAWKNDCFYSGKITETDRAAWEERLRDARDPGQVIGPGCQVAPIQLVTRVECVLGGETRIYYGKTGMSMIKILLNATEGQELLDAVQKSRPDWRHDVRKEKPGKGITDGLKGVGAFAFFAVFFWVFYFAIEAGTVDRAHWIIALIVNIAGTLPLAIMGGLCSLLTLLMLGLVVLSAVGVAVTKPAETHVLRPA